MNNFFIVVAIILPFIINQATASCANNAEINLKKVVQDPIFDPHIPFSLLEIASFRDLLSCSEEIENMAKRVLSALGPSENEKITIAFAMQSLRGQKYMAFIRYVTNLFKNNKISERVFSSAIFPGLEWNTYLQEHFSEPEVQALLRDIIQNTSYKSQFLDTTVSGEAFNTVLIMRRDGELPPIKGRAEQEQ